jgi:hypothetical protein
MRKLVLVAACGLALLSVARGDDAAMQPAGTQQDDQMSADGMKHDDMQQGNMKHDDGSMKHDDAMKPGSMEKHTKMKSHARGKMREKAMTPGKDEPMGKGDKTMEQGGKM